MADKIKRDAFVYLEPELGTDKKCFAQCSTCRMFVPGKGEEDDLCVLHGSHVEVEENYSCALYAPWPTADGRPIEEVVKDHARELKKGISGSVTPVESGLVEYLVQCHRCKFVANSEYTKCGLYKKLNTEMPDEFDLDDNIHPNACCNAQMPRITRKGDNEAPHKEPSRKVKVRLKGRHHG